MLVLARHYKDQPDAESFHDELEHEQAIGAPRIVLPPLAKLLAAKSHAELAKLLPPDYALDARGCFTTQRSSIERAEELWLASIGAPVPRVWNPLLGDVSEARYAAGTLVTRGRFGVCVQPADPVALRARMNTLGSCFTGSFEDVLLHPHWQFPTTTAFTQVSTQADHACALSTAGEITCCGPALPPPPKGPFTQVAVGGVFACALDAAGAATCWGQIGAPPAGPFAKVSAAYNAACAIRPTGELVCWGATRGTQPTGTFTDVVTAQFSSCALRSDHGVACWGDAARLTDPPGRFTQLAATWTHACGVHTDGTLGCWSDGQVDTPLAGTFAEVAVGDTFRVCARTPAGQLSCTQGPPPPAGTFTQLAGDHDTFCAVSADHHVACWGQPWPREEAPPPPVKGNRVVDEHGQPIAGAEVLACTDSPSCFVAWRQTTWERKTLAQLTTGARDTAITTTRADGTWSIAIHPREVVVMAAGREAVLTNQLAEIALRPAASLDVDASCGTAPCGRLRIAAGPLDWRDGTHVERLAPGTHRIEVASDFGSPGERRGVATVTVTFAGGALKAAVALAPIGTGKAIEGTAEIDGRPAPGAHVSVLCERPTPSMPVMRSTIADDHGNFVLSDVGKPPCSVDASGPNAIGSQPVDHVPADHVRVRAQTMVEPLHD